LQRQAFALTSLTADLFDLSTISRGKMRLTMKLIDLREEVRSAIDTIRPALESHRHTLEVELPEQPLFVTADATRLTQVVVNLLTNSIKYTDDGGHIRISASIEQPHIVVRVIDNGIGISREHLPWLFELGEQVEKNIERSEGGLGIGLAVVRRLVEMHGGSAVATSDGSGHGCEFTVRLPIAKQHAGASGAVDASCSIDECACRCDRSHSIQLSAPRILVVDDHGSIAKTCSAILRDYGCEARFATGGKSAIQIVRDFEPDIVLIDINMPAMNGYELAQRIKETPTGKNATLIAMTGAAGEREVRRCTEVGYASCLVKPLNIDDLRRIADHRMECPNCQPRALDE
jgi:CheY-like chemotaxis protein